MSYGGGYSNYSTGGAQYASSVSYDNQGAYGGQGYGGACTTSAEGHQVCYYKGPPAKDGLHAYRIYTQQVGAPGQVFDIVHPPCHGRSALCTDCPILSWPALCPAKPFCPPSAPPCPVQCPCPGYNAGYATQTYRNFKGACC